MTFYIGILLLFLLCIYLGEVLGLIILCDNCELLEESRKYIFMVPLLRFGAFCAVFLECIRKNEWESLRLFIVCPGKNVVILCSINESIATAIESIPQSNICTSTKTLSRKTKLKLIFAIFAEVFSGNLKLC